MAIVKVDHVKTQPINSIKYAVNDKKTMDGLLVEAQNTFTDPNAASTDFSKTRRQFHCKKRNICRDGGCKAFCRVQARCGSCPRIKRNIRLGSWSCRVDKHLGCCARQDRRHIGIRKSKRAARRGIELEALAIQARLCARSHGRLAHPQMCGGRLP